LRFLTGCQRAQRRPGAYFDAAAEYLLANGQPDLRLVHGVLSKPIVFDHAWVLLPGGVIFDPVDQEFYPRTAYEELLGAVAEACYGVADVRAALAVHRNSGPWHKPAADAIIKNARGRPSARAVAPLVRLENLKAALSAFALGLGCKRLLAGVYSEHKSHL
jgi:hypothetical protein